jgi:hypothetical protein
MSATNSNKHDASTDNSQNMFIRYNNGKAIIPEHFSVVNGYDLVRVGTPTNPYTIVNESGYDYYILAGIEPNETFSSMIMNKLNIERCCAVDNNPNKISVNFPENMKILNKRVGVRNSKQYDNLGYFVEKYNNMFLKLNGEGEEYLWVLAIPPELLLKFKQVIIVFNEVNINPTQARANNKIKCFQKMISTHNIAFMKYTGTNLIITYIRKDVTMLTENNIKEATTKKYPDLGWYARHSPNQTDAAAEAARIQAEADAAAEAARIQAEADAAAEAARIQAEADAAAEAARIQAEADAAAEAARIQAEADAAAEAARIQAEADAAAEAARIQAEADAAAEAARIQAEADAAAEAARIQAEADAAAEAARIQAEADAAAEAARIQAEADAAAEAARIQAEADAAAEAARIQAEADAAAEAARIQAEADAAAEAARIQAEADAAAEAARIQAEADAAAAAETEATTNELNQEESSHQEDNKPTDNV